MALKQYNPTTPGQRGLVLIDRSELFKGKPIKVFGPDRISSKLEGSKIFTKEICQKNNIPTSKFKIFKNLNQTIDYLKNSHFPLVIKMKLKVQSKNFFQLKLSR